MISDVGVKLGDVLGVKLGDYCAIKLLMLISLQGRRLRERNSCHLHESEEGV